MGTLLKPAWQIFQITFSIAIQIEEEVKQSVKYSSAVPTSQPGRNVPRINS